MTLLIPAIVSNSLQLRLSARENAFMNNTESLSNRKLPVWLLRIRIPLLVSIHALVFAGCYALAFAVRFDGAISSEMQAIFWKSLPVIVAVQIAAFSFSKTFHGWWRYVTFRDLISFVKPLTIGYLAVLAIDLLVLPYHIPRSIPLIQTLLVGFTLCVLRSSWRIFSEIVALLKPDHSEIRALLISNHHETLVMANQINCQQGSTTRIVGILTFEKPLVGSQRAGIPIVGMPEQAPALAKKHRATQIWIAAGSIPGSELAKLKEQYDSAGLITKVFPMATDRNLGGGFIPLREIEINDLLRRPEVELDAQSISQDLTGRRILVTGAGGSIGSELCRQIVRFNPAELILLDHRENSVFLIHNELQRILAESKTPLNSKLIPAVGDILDRERMTQIFQQYTPELVFHAAAHKHVGLMEISAGEAIKNNILGTRQIADLSNEFGVVKFVLVSTDKAVNPTSVMGCSKQIAERYILSLGSHSETRFIAVRFGNVLGSNGSVVPIFKEQIARGGPITITDPRMTRFFMTIPEATQLILQAGSMGTGGEIFVLDMGEQVRIVDLAEKMIELAGLPSNSIDIQFVGARPGEKLSEELYFDEEESIKTSHQKIFAARHRTLNYEEVLDCVNHLSQFQSAPANEVRWLLKHYIPEYQHNGQAMPPLSTSDINC